MKLRIAALATACAMGVGIQPIMAQNFDLPPAFGDVTLAPGFPDDPFTVDIVAGGDINAGTTIGAACAGFIADAPDFRVFLEGEAATLYLSVVGEEDTTLVVNDPNGDWHCDDDSFEMHPAVVLEDAPAGQYDIWIGTMAAGATSDATLYVSEIGTGPEYLAFLAANAPTDPPDVTLPAALGEIDLVTGFTPDPFVMEVVAGGDRNASALGGECVGFIAEAADVALNFQAGELPLIIAVVADADTTLVVRDPDGNWICDDDDGGEYNPYIDIATPVSGQYQIWIGTYTAGGFEDAELLISEVPG